MDDATQGPAQDAALLTVSGLTKFYPTRSSARIARRAGAAGQILALADVSFEVRAGESVGIAGESGCGKSTLLRCLAGVESPTSGDISLRGTSDERQTLAWVPQNPYSSLDPRMTVSAIVSEPVRSLGQRPTPAEIHEALSLVSLQSGYAARFPHQLSGGERQRVSIARGLAVKPELLLLDEPVSALDVSVQATVLNVLRDIQAELGVTYIMVAHDLAVIGALCDRILVMYLGRVVEEGSISDVYGSPLHPYTQALLSSVPIPDPAIERGRERILLSGEVGSAPVDEAGCPFRSRCPVYDTQLTDAQRVRCETTPPALADNDLGGGHRASCHYVQESETSWKARVSNALI